MTDKKTSINNNQPAKPSKETVYVDVDDDITTIIDKVEAAKEKIVAVVLPKRSTVLQSTVNMRLLKRRADHAGKKIVLITSDTTISPLAGIAGLHVAKNLQSKPFIPGKEAPDDGEVNDEDPKEATLDYHRSIGELAAVSALDEPEEIDMGDDETKPTDKSANAPNSKIKIPDFDKFRLKLLIFAVFGAGLLIFLYLAIFVLPKAFIIVKTGGVEIYTDFSLTASGDAESLDLEKGLIPASLQTKDQTIQEQVTASGERNDGDKATGSVTISIPCSQVTGPAPVVPAGTGVSSGGLTFVTQQEARLDNPDFSGGCKFIDTINVIAQEGGSKYNIGASSFTVAGYSAISASSSSAMTGGTDKITKVVSQSDIDKVKQKITTENSDGFSQTFLSELDGQGFYPIESTLKLSDPKTSASPAVGQPASTTNVTVKVSYKVMAVKKDDLSKVVTAELNKKMDTSKQELAGDNVLTNIKVSVTDQKSPTLATLEISQTALAVPIIDENEVRILAAGQKTSTIKNAVSAIPGVEEVEVKMTPFWVSVAPKRISKITVIQEQITIPQADQQSESSSQQNDQNP